MLYAVICTDKPSSLNIRLENRPAHVAFLESLGERLAFAGPFTDDRGNPNGSLVVFEARDMKAAEAVADQDPYAAAGLFESRTVRPWKWVFNAPVER